MIVPRPSQPAPIVTVLAIVGIAGGLVLLAAFLVDIPPALNTWRLVLFEAGGVAIAIATCPWHAAVARRLAIAGAVPVVAANTLGIIWILVAIGRPSPFSGGFGLAGFWLGIAMWLADAWFGLVALRIGALPRWVALGLVAGSLLAILGIDRIGLTSSANPTIFGPVSLVGIALNGAAWVALGIEVLVDEWRGSGGEPPRHLAT